MSLLCNYPHPVLPVRYGIIYLPDKPETGNKVNRIQNGCKPESKPDTTPLWKFTMAPRREQEFVKF